MITIEEKDQLLKIANANDGHCDRCHQTIKFYQYRINRVHAQFLKTMADAVRDTGVNDVDISTLSLPYSMRSQNSKLRQHGLIARVKDARGVQIPNRWLITHKGYDFLNGKPVPSKVVVYNNQVLGHDGGLTTIVTVLGGATKNEPVYNEQPVSPPEARTYDDVRKPKRKMSVNAEWRGYSFGQKKLVRGQTYELLIDKLQVGKPILGQVEEVGILLDYKDIAAFQRDWKISK